MYLRLAFAAAMEFEPAVLVLDEVLAVGDERFQKKCMDRIAELKQAGTTLIVTSHSPEQILSLCDEVLVLEEETGSSCKATLKAPLRPIMTCSDNEPKLARPV